MNALYPPFLMVLAAPTTASADDLFYRGQYRYGVFYDPAEIDWFYGRPRAMELTLREDGTYEWTIANTCGPWTLYAGVWTNLGDGFVLEDFYDDAPMVGRFRGSRAAGRYLQPAGGDWHGWTLHEPGSRPWPKTGTLLWGERMDGSKLRIDLYEDSTCILKEYVCSGISPPGRYCTWSVDPITRLPLIESDTRLIPSPIPEPGCFHLDDGGLGVDVCAY